MSNEVCELDVVEPGTILFIHGVGLAPRLFHPVMTMLSQPSAAPLRPPYRTTRPTTVLRPPGEHPAGYVAAQADALLDHLTDAHDVTLVGVSGGATIVLAAATRNHPGVAAVAGVIAHEPLIGPLAADLHSAVAASAKILADDPTDQAASDFVERLVGSTWRSLPSDVTDFALAHAMAIRQEVPGFAAYAMSPAEIAAAKVPITVTTGELSHQRRHRAASEITQRCAARSLVIPGAAHLVHWEQPSGFAALIADEQARWAEAA
ncbi:MAG TPA: alpha/beta hydrolase [Ilumatobacter sp.]|nr:alpha/beta hydrolase [Ilumatobacter sp.]